MEMIIQGRGYGKTKRMIELCAEHDGYIVCKDFETAQKIAKRAEDMGLDIRFPVSFGEWLGRPFWRAGVRQFFIDDLDLLVKHMIYRAANGVPIRAASATENGLTEMFGEETSDGE